MAPFEVRVETGGAALALLDERWDDLVARQPLPNPLLSATWLRELACWQTGLPLVAVAESQGELVAGAALELRRPGGRLGPTVATWLGPVEQLFSADMLADPRRPEAIEEVAAAVLDEADVLTIGAPSARVAAHALAVVAPWRSATDTAERWIASCAPAELEYARKRAAYELRWSARRGAEVQISVAREPAEVAAALERLFRLNRVRWRDRLDETPRFATTQAHRRWNRRAVAAMAELGRVRIVEVVEDGRVVAGCLGFVYADGGLAHTQGMRLGGTLREPGQVVILAIVEALGEAGATAVDLGYGSGQPGGPKQRLGTTGDPMSMIVAARSGGLQRPYEAMRWLRNAARAARRRRPSAP
ncbi:MAG TPA: GNAT family N-acetyltransferase [Gaiellaceae bacterium]